MRRRVEHCIPPDDFTVAQIEILSEHELAGAWRFEAQVLDEDGALRQHALTLSWADYNLWSQDGADAPARVADAVLHFLLLRGTASSIPPKLDASLARRLHGDADLVIPTLIGR